MGHGEIVSVDIEHKPWRPAHPRLTYLHGPSTATEIVAERRQRARGKQPVMLILDSDHSTHHVLGEMRALGPLVPNGNSTIVEDRNAKRHPVLPDLGAGPTEAIEAFMAENDEFWLDRSRERFLVTFNPGGYLRRNPGTHRHR